MQFVIWSIRVLPTIRDIAIVIACLAITYGVLVYVQPVPQNERMMSE